MQPLLHGFNYIIHRSSTSSLSFWLLIPAEVASFTALVKKVPAVAQWIPLFFLIHSTPLSAQFGQLNLVHADLAF